jgi:hypothetical protein
VDGWTREPRGGLVMTAGRHAGGYATAHLEHGDLMAPGAVTYPHYGGSTVSVDPSSRVVVPVVLGDCGSTLAPAAAKDRKG